MKNFNVPVGRMRQIFSLSCEVQNSSAAVRTALQSVAAAGAQRTQKQDFKQGRTEQWGNKESVMRTPVLTRLTTAV